MIMQSSHELPLRLQLIEISFSIPTPKTVLVKTKGTIFKVSDKYLNIFSICSIFFMRVSWQLLWIKIKQNFHFYFLVLLSASADISSESKHYSNPISGQDDIARQRYARSLNQNKSIFWSIRYCASGLRQCSESKQMKIMPFFSVFIQVN